MKNLKCLLEDHHYALSKKICTAYNNEQRKKLNLFKQFLELKCETDSLNIYLDKLYTYFDSNNKVIKYEPIDSSIIEEFFTIHKEKSDNWKNIAKISLSNFFKYVQYAYNLTSPLENVEVKFNGPNSKKEYKNIYSRQDILRFLNALITSNKDTFVRDLLLYTIWFTTGCRPNEIITIRVSDIQFDQHQIILNKTKSKKQRLLLLSETLSKDTTQYCNHFHLSGDDYLFQTKTGTSLSLNDLKILTSFYFKKANCEYINLYAIRHTFATLLYESNVAIPTIQQALGHSSIHTTKAYIHPNYIRNIGVINKRKNQLYKTVSSQINTFIRNQKAGD